MTGTRKDQEARDAAWAEFMRDGERSNYARLDSALTAYQEATPSPVGVDGMREALEKAAMTMAVCRSAVSSGQIVDKEVEVTLERGVIAALATITAALTEKDE